MQELVKLLEVIQKMANLNFNERPILVFWETTRACLLSCKHCRAEAMENPLPGELSSEEAFAFVESLTKFGRPYPVLILTGGDVLMRQDIFEIVARAKQLGIPVGLSPSVTPRLTDENIQRMSEYGIKAVSISLDGALHETHESIRGVSGHFQKTIEALRRLVAAGFTVQVNTAVMRENVKELPQIAQILKETGVSIWEVFFLIPIGRGQSASELTPAECEDVVHFLFEASTYDLTVRTVEAPFFRRVVSSRLNQSSEPEDLTAHTAERHHLGPLYKRLSQELRERLGQPTSNPLAQSSKTRDGKGIIFVTYDGNVFPAGFLPYALGNIREQELATIYREHPLLKDIRNAKFTGKCGICEYRDLCGGSRARAYATSGNPLGEDPACHYVPKSSHQLNSI
jgi:radical SAM protein